MLNRSTAKLVDRSGSSPDPAYVPWKPTSRSSTSPMPWGSPAGRSTASSRRHAASMRTWAASWACSSETCRSSVTCGRRPAATSWQKVATKELYAGRPCSPNRFGSTTSAQRAGQLPEELRGSSLAPAVGVVELGLHGVGEDHVDRTLAERCGEGPGQLDVALLDGSLGVGAVDPGEVQDGVDLGERVSQRARVGELLAPEEHGLDGLGSAEPAGGVPAQEPGAAGDGHAGRHAHVASSFHPECPTGADHRASSQPGTCCCPNHIISSRREAPATGPATRPSRLAVAHDQGRRPRGHVLRLPAAEQAHQPRDGDPLRRLQHDRGWGLRGEADEGDRVADVLDEHLGRRAVARAGHGSGRRGHHPHQGPGRVAAGSVHRGRPEHDDVRDRPRAPAPPVPWTRSRG